MLKTIITGIVRREFIKFNAMTVIVKDVGNIEFSIVLHNLIQAYNKLPKGDDVKKKLKESAHTILRKWCDLQVPLLHSEKAYELIKKQDIGLFSGTVTDMEFPLLFWQDRNYCGKDERGRSNLVYEHTTPISQFFIELCQTKTLKEVENKLSNYSGVCWITREEDDILTKKFRTKRPNGWRACYKECGIEVEDF